MRSRRSWGISSFSSISLMRGLTYRSANSLTLLLKSSCSGVKLKSIFPRLPPTSLVSHDFHLPLQVHLLRDDPSQDFGCASAEQEEARVTEVSLRGVLRGEAIAGQDACCSVSQVVGHLRGEELGHGGQLHVADPRVQQPCCAVHQPARGLQ